MVGSALWVVDNTMANQSNVEWSPFDREQSFAATVIIILTWGGQNWHCVRCVLNRWEGDLDDFNE